MVVLAMLVNLSARRYQVILRRLLSSLPFLQQRKTAVRWWESNVLWHGNNRSMRCVYLWWSEDYTANLSGGTGLEIVSKEVTQNILSVVPNPVKGYAATVNLDLQKQGSVNIRVTDLPAGFIVAKCEQCKCRQKCDYTAWRRKIEQGAFMVTAEQNNIIIGRTQLIRD